ncbi:Ltp family lipoprotein [Psychrobacter sp. PSP]|uniref:Ltp family lipoprotein n=1 Tax=Psychrobacter sp. PSP TaxID=2734636 RepID=UPI0020955536|nr:Ltp family lipoprotein [Psychrobacter sp. PSP]
MIEQLYEIHEYTKDEAKTAVDSLDVDWKEQAVKSAEDNLRYSSYSRKGLIEQLHEIQEYTKDEAAYAAEKTGVCS